MGAKYSHKWCEYFADQASTILVKTNLIFFTGVQTLAGLLTCVFMVTSLISEIYFPWGVCAISVPLRSINVLFALVSAP